MKKTITIVALILFLTVDVIAFFIFGEKETNSFGSYQEAMETGIIRKGWIPSFIPQSSFNIREHHRVDEPSIYVEFDFRKDGLGSIIDSCDNLHEDIYICENAGYPVKTTIVNKSHATMQSL